MLKITTLSTPIKLACTRINKIKPDTDDSSRIGIDIIANRIENLLNSTKLKKSSETDFLTFRVKEAFTHLQKTFIKAPILRYFDLKCYIRIEIDALGYVIDGVFC